MKIPIHKNKDPEKRPLLCDSYTGERCSLCELHETGVDTWATKKGSVYFTEKEWEDVGE